MHQFITRKRKLYALRPALNYKRVPLSNRDCVSRLWKVRNDCALKYLAFISRIPILHVFSAQFDSGDFLCPRTPKDIEIQKRVWDMIILIILSPTCDTNVCHQRTGECNNHALPMCVTRECDKCVTKACR